VYPRELEVPGIDEQRAIAAVLGSLDDKIELNRQMNETLEATARAIFKSWFVDFDPVRAKMEGRDTGLVREVAALFPDSFQDDGLPKGWGSDTLLRLVVTNAESWTANNHPQTIEYVDLSNTKWGNIENTTFFDWADAPTRARRISKVGDTILGTTRPGNGSFAYIARSNLTVSTGFAVLSPRSVKYRDAVYLFSTDPDNIARLARLADGHGGAYPAVKPDDVTDTPIVFPGDEVLSVFADIAAPLRRKIEHTKSEIQVLASVRDLLLPRLVSGEVRIKDADKLVGEAGHDSWHS
jgi:type I restriction enzyme S subunit